MQNSVNTFKFTSLISRYGLIAMVLSGSIFIASCTSEKSPATTAANTEIANTETAAVQEQPAEDMDPSLLDKLRNDHWKGDIDGLQERRYIRVLTLYNKTNFFYDGPQPKGITYEAVKEFEKFLNTKLNTGNKPVHVIFIPVNREEMLKRMTDGRGDIAAANIPIVDEMKEIVDFSAPLRENAKELIVTGKSAPPINTLDDLSGKEVFVRKFSRYWPNLVRLNDRFKQEGRPPVILKEADQNLEDEDILNMVNAELVGITAMDDVVADLWAGVFDGLTVHKDVSLEDNDQIGWAVQKGAAPKLLDLINEFGRDHKLGTSFGNTLFRRYLKDTKWALNNTAPTEVAKYKSAVGFFKKYGGEYDFDWLMIAAQAYQESQIDQSRHSPAGAVGVMQIKPSTAEDKNVGITNVEGDIDHNINAGVKYLNFIMKTYFADAKMNKINRGLFAFASYNAGPARVAKLRKTAEAEGLDPNIWFNNVEMIAAREIGAETVTYVSNIYKYYIAYKMVQAEMGDKKAKVH